MVSVKTRRLAVPMVVACAGVFAGSATRARAAGGLSVTPAALEHTRQARHRRLAHAQQHDQGDAAGDRHRPPVAPAAQRQRRSPIRARRSSAYVRATTQSFTIGAGASARCRFRMVRRTRQRLALRQRRRRSASPPTPRAARASSRNYRLISKLRLNPVQEDVQAQDRRRPGALGRVVLPVRNLGNTIDPIGGTYRSPARARRSGNMAASPPSRASSSASTSAPTRGHEEGPLHRQRAVTQAGKLSRERASRFADPGRTTPWSGSRSSPSRRRRSSSAPARSTTRAGSCTPGRDAGAARTDPGIPHVERASVASLGPARGASRSSCSTASRVEPTLDSLQEAADFALDAEVDGFVVGGRRLRRSTPRRSRT